MRIKRFKKFNEEVQIKTFDLVINDQGDIEYDGTKTLNWENTVPLKGYLDKKGTTILGSDNKQYIAAIDRTGSLFTFLDTDNNGNILLDDNKIKVGDGLNTKSVFWNTKEDYTNILPILPTGWVNVKLDMEVIKRIRRYSKGITRKKGIEGLKDRLEVLKRTDLKVRHRKSETIRKEMSAIMMLHYLNELKGHFDPSSAGFLFESYIAGLISDSKVKEDNSAVDIIDSSGNKYQVKLLDFNNHRTNIVKKDGDYLDYYIMAYKFADKIKVFLLDGNNEKSENYVENFKAGRKKRKDEKDNNDYFSFPKFRRFENSSSNFVIDLPLLNINDKIKNIAKGLKETLDVLYNNLSQFQFNVETILTGVDEEGELIDEDGFDVIQLDSEANLSRMEYELSNLMDIIKSD